MVKSLPKAPSLCPTIFPSVLLVQFLVPQELLCCSALREMMGFLAGRRCLFDAASRSCHLRPLLGFPPFPQASPRSPFNSPFCPQDVLPPTQLHTHVPPYRKKSQVSKRHSQPDQLTRCLPSPLPEQAHLEQGSLFRGRVVAFVAFSPDCFLRRDLLGGFPGASASL